MQGYRHHSTICVSLCALSTVWALWPCPPRFPRCRLQLLFIRNIPIMIGGLGMGFAGGVLLWFFNSPSTFALFLARRVGIDPAMVTRAAASANAADEK